MSSLSGLFLQAAVMTLVGWALTSPIPSELSWAGLGLWRTQGRGP